MEFRQKLSLNVEETISPVEIDVWGIDHAVKASEIARYLENSGVELKNTPAVWRQTKDGERW